MLYLSFHTHEKTVYKKFKQKIKMCFHLIFRQYRILLVQDGNLQEPLLFSYFNVHLLSKHISWNRALRLILGCCYSWSLSLKLGQPAFSSPKQFFMFVWDHYLVTTCSYIQVSTFLGEPQLFLMQSSVVSYLDNDLTGSIRCYHHFDPYSCLSSHQSVNFSL